jgi:hypothetical protein
LLFSKWPTISQKRTAGTRMQPNRPPGSADVVRRSRRVGTTCARVRMSECFGVP